jgi:hypothetical protein
MFSSMDSTRHEFDPCDPYRPFLVRLPLAEFSASNTNHQHSFSDQVSNLELFDPDLIVLRFSYLQFFILDSPQSHQSLNSHFIIIVPPLPQSHDGQWQPLIDQVIHCVPAWQRGMIQKSGRLILIKSVISARPVHQLMVAEAPAWVLE